MHVPVYYEKEIILFKVECKKNVVDNKTFWKTVKTFFSDKSSHFKKLNK